MGKVGNLENYFNSFRENILGIDQTFQSPYGTKKIVYTDWTASGRLYTPIEEKMMNELKHKEDILPTNTMEIHEHVYITISNQPIQLGPSH